MFKTKQTKIKGTCEGASKQSSYRKNYTAPGPPPPSPVLKFLDPPLATKYEHLHTEL